MRNFRVAAVAAVLFAALGAGQAAWGHAAYKDSDPADGERVGSPPGRVTAEFTEPLADGSYLRVADPCGTPVDNGDVSISGFTMSVSMSASTAGRYVVTFRAHSQLDPHVVDGTFSFTATSGEACAGAASDPEEGSGSDAGGGGSAGAGDSDTGSSGAAAGSADGSGSRSSRTESRSGGGGTGNAVKTGGGGADLRPGEQRARVANIAAPQDERAERKSVWDGIRLEPFLTGLLLAAIIGAAGGKIYAGIMGPRA